MACSTEAEVREILEHAVKAEQRPRLGDLLAELGRKGRPQRGLRVLEDTRDRKPAKPMKIA